MRIWTVHLPPERGARRAPVLVREGFSWSAFLFGPLWLLANGLWLSALLLLLAGVALGLLPPVAAFAAELALALLTGAFARDLRRWSLARRGWLLANVVVARDRDSALARLLEARPELTARWAAA
ncbi:MAG TPA: DUF2628 domain-containing protein [Crenalkalicoccus sp.]|jgi:hypothetical protein|nr:DUF2628 domain-containing protein [Crenalkalicoccus sp.]